MNRVKGRMRNQLKIKDKDRKTKENKEGGGRVSREG